MKLEKVEHNHKLTNILKISLFALLMIMPFLACLPSITYFAFNKHAENYTNQTITETYEYETNEINNPSDIVLGNIYKFDMTEDDNYFTSYAIRGGFSFTFITGNVQFDFSIIDDLSAFEDPVLINDLHFFFDFDSSGFCEIYLVSDNGDIFYLTTDDLYLYQNGYFYAVINYVSSDFEFAHNFINASDYLGQTTYTINESEMNPLTVFYTANEQVWQQPLFSWVNNGLFTNSLGAFIGVFGIAQNSYFNNLLTYWLVLIIIYIIIDLILGLFTLITHIICNRKVKE